jgi:hypothetical protein
MSIKHHSNENFLDNNKLTFGTGDDLQIYHDGSNSYITNSTGDLTIDSGATDKDIIFKGTDTQSSVATDITALTLNMSDQGNAQFNAGATFSNVVTIIAGGPKLNLQDNTDDDDQQINFLNNSGVTDYMIRTSDPTSGGGGDGFYIGSVQSDGEVALFTNNTTALTLDTSQNATFAGTLTASALTLEGTTDQILNLKVTDDGPVYHAYLRGTDRHAYVGFGGSSDTFNIANEESSGTIDLRTGGGTIALTLDASQNATFAGGITVGGTVLGTSAKFGRDADNLLDFTVDNEITFRANASDEMVLNGSTLSPHASDGLALGTSSLMWSDLFLASGGVINFNNGDVTMTHSSNKLTISGGTTTINSLELGAADHVIEDGANILDENDNTLFTLASGNVGVGGALTVGGTITTPSDIIHTGDTDTKISFGTNTVTVTAGNINTVVASQEGASITKRKFAKTGTTDGDADGDIVYLGGTTSMSVGKIYHFKSDGTWELADADSAATCDGLLGVALGSSSDDQGVLLRGMVTIANDPGAVGDVLFVSTSAGQAVATAPSGNGDIVRVVGYCLDASNGQIWFNPDSTFVEVTA